MGVSIAWRDDRGINAMYLPFRHIIGPNYELRRFLQPLQQLLSTKSCVFHNAKFDLESLRTLGLDTDDTHFYDTMLMAHLLDENKPISGKGLDSLCRYYLKNEGKHRSPELAKMIKNHGWGMIPTSFMVEYAAWDAALTLELFEMLKPFMRVESLQGAWKTKERFTRRIMKMERRGVRVDTAFCEEKADTGHSRMGQIIQELGGLVPSKPSDLEKLLIDDLGLPRVYHRKSGNPTFDKTAMEYYEEQLEGLNLPTARLVLEYRGWQKSVSSNYEPYVELLSPDGRLRCNYKLHGTKTGRISCEKPNLQQIPRSGTKAWNGDLKQAFVPDAGFTLIEADYSQLELRIGTHFAKDREFADIFADERRNFFDELAATLRVDRDRSKTFQYALNYGAGANRIAEVLKISRSEAQELIRRYFAAHPGFKRLSAYSQGYVERNGKIPTLGGRFRHFEWRSEAHKAWNSVIQGSAADIVERAMLDLSEGGFDSDDCRMLLQVHDSVVFEVRDEYVSEAARGIAKVMTSTGMIDTHMQVDIHKWGTKENVLEAIKTTN